MLVLTASTAPWWGVPLIAGGFLVVGAVLAFLATYITKNRELRRLDQARWDNDILEGTIRITDAIERLQWHLFVLSDPSDLGRDSFMLDYCEAVLAVEGELRESQKICKRFKLITSGTTCGAAVNISILFDDILQEAANRTDQAALKVQRIASELNEHGGILHENARIDLRAKTTDERAPANCADLSAREQFCQRTVVSPHSAIWLAREAQNPTELQAKHGRGS